MGNLPMSKTSSNLSQHRLSQLSHSELLDLDDDLDVNEPAEFVAKSLKTHKNKGNSTKSGPKVLVASPPSALKAKKKKRGIGFKPARGLRIGKRGLAAGSTSESTNQPLTHTAPPESSTLSVTQKMWQVKPAEMENQELACAEQGGEEGLVDPIMLLPIGPDEPTYTFTRPNGTKVVFVIETLVEYMQTSRRFVDPESQIKFTDEDLREMEDAAEQAGLPRPELIKAKHDVDTNREYKNKLDSTYGVDRMIGLRVSQMLEIIEGKEPKQNVERTLHRLFDEASRYYQQLCYDQTNFEFAVQCRQHYIEYLKGPPNKPTKEREGLLKKCIDFLEGLAILTMAFD